jgi:hypothetical protein
MRAGIHTQRRWVAGAYATAPAIWIPSCVCSGQTMIRLGLMTARSNFVPQPFHACFLRTSPGAKMDGGPAGSVGWPARWPAAWLPGRPRPHGPLDGQPASRRIQFLRNLPKMARPISDPISRSNFPNHPSGGVSDFPSQLSRGRSDFFGCASDFCGARPIFVPGDVRFF